MTQQRQHEEIRAALEDIAAEIREDKEPSSDVFTKDEYGYFLHLMYQAEHTGRYYNMYDLLGSASRALASYPYGQAEGGKDEQGNG